MAEHVLTFTDKGLYCPAGDFYVDPWRPVARAVITHGHSDHARSGHDSYLATPQSLGVLRHRLGKITTQGLAYDTALSIGGAKVSLHPAGHLPGSAQVRVEVAGEVWCVSGDYKTEADGLCEDFAPVPCHSFISECTFGLPVFRWQPQAVIAAQINAWWQGNAAAGRPSVLGAYSLGKAQRLLALLDTSIGPVMTHPSVEAINGLLRAEGYGLPATQQLDSAAKAGDGLKRALIIAPPNALSGAWGVGLDQAEVGFASGWMALRGLRQSRGPVSASGGGRGFTLSDHADWPGLISAIRATGAERVFVTHGYTKPFCRWLKEAGWDAGIVKTQFEGEIDPTEEEDTVTEAASPS